MTTHHDAAWHELQYNPRLTVANASEIIPEWRRRAIATRERMPPHSDLKYGPHPRETIDLFRAENPRGTLVYIHGGYWRMLSKLETSWVAEHFLEQGISVALINYPLCPDVPLPHIRGSALHAFAYLYKDVLIPAERGTIVMSGHSAGGHLAALHLATDWRRFNLPENPLSGVISLSGIFDVAPLCHTSMNTDLRLTPALALPLNVIAAAILSRAKCVLAVGALESEEFHRQSHDLGRAWNTLAPQLINVPDANHYTIVDSLADSRGLLHRLACDMFEG
jgi:arylformamidase